MPAVALGLTAFAWLPTLDAIRHSGGDIASYGERVLPGSGRLRMLKILSPWLTRKQGLTSAQRWVGYIGIAPVVVIAAAWPRAPRALRWILVTCVALGGAALALHARAPVVRSVGNLPVLRSVRGDYWSSLAGAALAIAAGVAVAVIARHGAGRRAATITGGVLAAGISAAWLVSEVLGWGAVPAVGLLAALALIAALVAMARGTQQASRRRVLTLGIVGLMAVELFSYQNHTRLARLDIESSTPAYVTFLRDHLGSGRVMNAGTGGLFPEWGAALGIPQIETLNIMQIPSYRSFYQRYVNPDNTGLVLQTGDNPSVSFDARPDALDLLSVRYLVVDQRLTRYDAGVRARYPLAFTDDAAGVRVYRNDSAFPRAYLSPALTESRNPLPAGWSRSVTTTDDKKLLANARSAGIPARAAPGTSSGTARVVRSGNDRVEIEVDATKPSVLVLTDSFHPNWDARVNGHAEHVGRVNGVVRGVVVPPGRSTVVFRYHSRARAAGVVVSFATLVALGALVLVALLRRYRRYAASRATAASSTSGTSAAAR